MNDIVLLGPQGCGKGTQAKKLCEEYGFLHFNMGGELRKAAAIDNELGREIKKLIDNGILVPDSTIEKFFTAFVQNIPEGKYVIFDGVPRNKGQKDLFDKVITENNRSIKVLQIDIPEEETMKRLLKRAELEGRADDNEEAIKVRLQTYHNSTAPIIDEYKAEGVHIAINGMQNIEAVAAEIQEKLGL